MRSCMAPSLPCSRRRSGAPRRCTVADVAAYDTALVSSINNIAAMSSHIDMVAMSSYDDTMSGSPALTNVRSLPRLGTAVRMLRMQRGLTQAELARLAEVSRQWLIKLEAGKTAGLEIGLVLHVLDALDASLIIRDEAP